MTIFLILHTLTYRMILALLYQQRALDLSKAGNCIKHLLLIKKLARLFGFSRFTCELIYSYLAGTSQFVDINSIFSGIRPVQSGEPQNLVLGSLLFSMYSNDLLEHTVTNVCRPYLLADDIFLVSIIDCGKPDIIDSIINYSLRHLNTRLCFLVI